MINIKKFTFNPVGVNAYVLWDETKEAVIIDPACSNRSEEAALSRFVEEQGLRVVQLLNTHGHFDHLMGNSFAETKWGLKCRIHKGDLPMVSQAKQHAMFFGISMDNPAEAVELVPGEEIAFGHSVLRVIHVPGHSAGGVAYHCEADKLAVVGDILFEGSVGRTDLPGGNHALLISGIKEKLLTLPDETKVLPGHGNDTTIGRERRTNPFLQ
ncbi:MAG: MBL fold metallo-hydrolase [Prolixibacteraceae bacterium]|jgi:glyoxylase-like metal-dependent hydrolase (beta-lactamase superfamily II)|nr:MBL fold metallo-hydrolase [Prolixibacteraceae bacterium]